MGVQSLYTAATGMKAMDFKLGVIANNLANISTVAFKRSRANFEDILYHTIEQPGLENGLGQPLPLGKQLGIGVKLSSTQINFTQGSFNNTEERYDLAINGDGFFQVVASIDGAERTVFTRAGNFTLDADGQMVLGNTPGARLEPTITIPQDTVEVAISPQGTVEVLVSGATAFAEVGQIEMARFINNAGLLQKGSNLYDQTDASGPPILANPGQDGIGTLLSGHLELSNVDPATELIGLIQTQRAFELNSQSIQSADQTLQTVNQLRR